MPWAGAQATPFGAMGVRCAEGRISELVFLPAVPAGLVRRPDPLVREACRQIAAWVRDPHFRFELPLAPRGTDFQRRVWAAIAAVPLGHTRRYGEIARELQSSARAVGQACGDNPHPLVIPCHRVVAAAGLGGFAHHGPAPAGGAVAAAAASAFHLRAKHWLLAHEAGAVGQGRLL